MKAFTIYDRETGRIRGHYYGSPKHLEKNIPEGCAAVPGRHDPKSERIDVATRQPVAWTPPADSGRRAREVKRQITALEANQLRPLRELALDPDDLDARRRLAAIEAEIAKLRAELLP